MKTIIAVITLFAASLLPVFSKEIWGGKWSNAFLVFFIFEKTEEGEEMVEVNYLWEEHGGNPLSSSVSKALRKDGIAKVGSAITIRFEKDKAFAYGAFARPRAARLVKIDPDTKIEDLNRKALKAANWDGAVLDVAEIKKEVLGEAAVE